MLEWDGIMGASNRRALMRSCRQRWFDGLARILTRLGRYAIRGRRGARMKRRAGVEQASVTCSCRQSSSGG